eukprot:30552_1
MDSNVQMTDVSLQNQLNELQNTIQNLKQRMVELEANNQTTTMESARSRVLSKEIQQEKRKMKIRMILPETTNTWLIVKDAHDEFDEDRRCKCMNSMFINKTIAIVVLLIQITAYLISIYILWNKANNREKQQQSMCTGPNCDEEEQFCVSFLSGIVCFLLLFLTIIADTVDILGACRYSPLASFLCLIEVAAALVCGIFTALYIDSDFDKIFGAVGVLVIHDLDEKIFHAFERITRRKHPNIKKSLTLILWLITAFAVAFALTCKTSNGTTFFIEDPCKPGYFECEDSSCIWDGFICNGIDDCNSGIDELAC